MSDASRKQSLVPSSVQSRESDDDDDEEKDEVDDDVDEGESEDEPSSYYMTEDDGKSDFQSSCMVSHRVDTASNISHLSRMNRSGYSARMVLNKSCITSDVSDTSFSMFMYMPKKGGNKGTDTSSINQSSRDSRQSADERSYEYRSNDGKPVDKNK